MSFTNHGKRASTNSASGDKLTVVKYTFEGEKIEILVKPDPALDYKL